MIAFRLSSLSLTHFLFLIYILVVICCQNFQYVHSLRIMKSLRSPTSSSSSSSTTRLYDGSGTCPNAPKCNGEFRSQGCDGTGKVLGGLASVPGFSWFPAKVYRPCPSYLKAGYVYRREGQTMDQVLFSEPSNKMKEKLATIRANEWQEKQQQQEKEQQVSKKDASGSSDPNNIDAASKLLNEKYGKK
jgi:hypothetical protein